MLPVLLVLGTVSSLPPNTISSVSALDAVCEQAAFEGPIALHLDRGSFELVPSEWTELDRSFAPAIRPLRALNGRISIHLVDRGPLSWSGPLDESTARALVARNEVRATLVGQLARAEGFPTCFGHRQAEHRSISVRLHALYLYGKGGRPIGRYAEPVSEKASKPRLRAEVQARCGTPCVFDESELEAAVAAIRADLMACTTGSPIGTLALELATEEGGNGGVTVRGEVSTLTSPVQVCARAVLNRFRAPSRNEEGTILLQVRVVPDDQSSES